MSTLRGAPPQHTLGATICFGEERQVWTDLGWKFEPGKAPKATIWASKMAPKVTIWGSPGAPGGGPGHQNPPQKGVPEGSGRGPGASYHEVRYGAHVASQNWPILGPGTFWRYFRILFLERFGHRFGTPLGSDFEPNLGPKWGPKSSRKGS